MAKKEIRIMATLTCSKCGLSNVHTSRHRDVAKLLLNKHCTVCRDHTLHKEKK